MNANRKAFLKMIAVSEGTAHLGADGYNVIVGGQLFSGYQDHPRRKVWIKRIRQYSSAAGRYQILERYFDAYRKKLRLKDFSPECQDAIALQMIKEQGALQDIDEGRIEAAVEKCRNIWASFPKAGYGQHENKMSDLFAAYREAGGTVIV